MKYLFPLLLFVLGCTNHQQNTAALVKHKDTVLQTYWQIQDGDTVSGSALIVTGNGDTVIEDFGVNPNWNPDKLRKRVQP
jgi:hypothetical protein